MDAADLYQNEWITQVFHQNQLMTWQAFGFSSTMMNNLSINLEIVIDK